MVLPNNARALLRIVLRTVRNKYDSEESKIFDGLETHINEISESQGQLDRINLTARAVKNYSETDVDEGTVASYAAKVIDFSLTPLTSQISHLIIIYSWISTPSTLPPPCMTALASTCIHMPG